jgi:S-formylglutathione hydrolase FrmB
MPWSSATIANHPADVFEPSRRHEHGYVLIYLHGVHLNRLAEQPAFTELFEQHGLPVVSPHTQRSWWTDRICPEFDPRLTAERHLLDNVMPFIQEQWGVTTPKIGLLGTSMGGQGALRFAYKYPDKFPVVAAISPAIDYHKRYDEGDETIPQMYRDKEQARQDTALLHIHPLNWPRHQFFCCDPTDERWHESADRLRMKLWSLGVPHEIDLATSGGGHSFTYYSLMAPKAIGFLLERLDKERLRLA